MSQKLSTDILKRCAKFVAELGKPLDDIIGPTIRLMDSIDKQVEESRVYNLVCMNKITESVDVVYSYHRKELALKMVVIRTREDNKDKASNITAVYEVYDQWGKFCGPQPWEY